MYSDASAKAREMGAVTCGISCTPDSELSRAVDYPMEPAPGPEVIAGVLQGCEPARPQKWC